ncbi:MAG: hypothetical protein ACI3YT_07065 [Prevotella sp.]
MARSIKLSIPVEKQPIDIAPFLDITGSVTQKLQNDNGSYVPDRKSRPITITPKVRLVNPNVVDSSGKYTWTDAEITSVAWHIKDVGDKDWSELKAKTGEVEFSDNSTKKTLTYKVNVPSEFSGRTIRATINFKDPSTLDADGNQVARSCTIEQALTTYVSAALSLSLVDNPGTSASYAQDGYVINPINTPYTSQDSWKRSVRCQLKDGSVNVEMANNGSDYNSTPQGNAFYFWYQVIGRDEILLTADAGWFDGTFYADGTASPECTVDLAKIQNVHLRCRAGYIPYGQLADYIDANTGKILPSACDRGYLSIDYRLSVRLPSIQKMEVIPVSKDVCLKSELGRSDVPFIRRLHIVCAGRTLNDLSLTAADWSKRTEKTLVEKLFNITWTYNNTSSSGEFLNTTMAGVGSSTSNPNPEISVEVSPVYPDLWGDNYVVGYKDDDLGVEPIANEKHGNMEWLRNYNFVLCDMSSDKVYPKTGDDGMTYNAKAHTILQRDNLLRNIDGVYSPAVVISDEQYADSTLALYTKSGSTYSVYCTEGNYDPVAYVENMLRPFYKGTKTADAIKLYKKNTDGTYSEAHALLPWETVDNKWSIFLDSFGRDVYFLDNVVGKSGTCWRGIFSDLSNTDGGKWDGIDLSQYRMRRTGISPSPAATVTYNGKTVTRNMFYLKQGMTNCQGGAGTSTCTTMLQESGRTYPRVNDVNALTTATYSRNNNADVNAAYPVAEGGYNNMSATVMAQELIHGTKSLYTSSMYGSGISSNEACANETNFLLSGGTRMKLSTASSWTHYKKWSETAPFKPASGTAATNMTATLNQEYPKEQCMESLLVLSYAKEFGIAENTDFYVYGGKYRYVTPDGCKGLSDGYMNARVYKSITGTVNGYNTSTSAAETWTVEAMLRTSICGGFNLAGDILSYWPGGADVIITLLNAPDVSKVGNKAEAYSEVDQLKWVRDTNVSLASTTQFNSQKAYKLRYTLNSTFNGWIKKRAPYAPIGMSSGGSVSQGECCYVTLNNDGYGSDLTVHHRAALRFRHYASHSACAPRSMAAHYPASHAYRSYGGSAQVLL